MTLRAQLLDSTSALLDQLPGVRDGNADAVHDARVATRRMRALMPILSACYPQADLKGTARTAKRAGRALGRVRDLDVAIELIGELEQTSPAVAGRAAEVRRAIAAKQLTARRRLVKEFDDLPLAELKNIPTHLPGGRWILSRLAMQEWDGPVREALREQAAALRHAIEHGSGVYFPKRAHAVRIDAKKLRYVLEMTSDPEAIAPGGLKALKKTQEVLGSLHDREVLRDRFARLAKKDEDDGSSVEAVVAAIGAECQQLFATYVTRRATLLEVCDAVERFAASTPGRLVRTGSLLRAASVALPVAALLAVRIGVARAARERDAHPPSNQTSAHGSFARSDVRGQRRVSRSG
jgi:CHAD domain-containing protein